MSVEIINYRPDAPGTKYPESLYHLAFAIRVKKNKRQNIAIRYTKFCEVAYDVRQNADTWYNLSLYLQQKIKATNIELGQLVGINVGADKPLEWYTPLDLHLKREKTETKSGELITYTPMIAIQTDKIGPKFGYVPLESVAAIYLIGVESGSPHIGFDHSKPFTTAVEESWL